jgi:hypothetical protein
VEEVDWQLVLTGGKEVRYKQNQVILKEGKSKK